MCGRSLTLGMWCLGWLICAPRAVAEGHSFGVPDQGSVAEATRLVKKTYGDEYAAARTPAQRAALASRLFKEATQTRDNRAARYVLLCEARELAAKAGDANVACRAIEQLSKHYGVSPGEVTLAALSEAARAAVTPPLQEVLARCAMAAADQAVLRDEYELSGRLAGIAAGAAERVKKVTLIDEAKRKVEEVAWARSEHQRAKEALEKLTTAPTDGAAKSAAGRFRCLVKGEWEAGLAMLMEGSDAAYRALAALDFAAATADASAKARAGDQWWDHGEILPARARACCRSRAAFWYRQCVAKVQGFTKTAIEKRLDEIERDRMRELRLERGLLAEIFQGKDFGTLASRRIDPRLDFTWEDGQRKQQGLPSDDFSVRWTGQLKVDTAGQHTLIVQANQGARIYIDERLILDEPDGSRKRKGEEQSLHLAEGLHSIRVEFWDTGGKARMQLLWATPGGADESPIPANAFYHEIGTDP